VVPFMVFCFLRPTSSYWKLPVRLGPLIFVNWSRLFYICVVPPVSVRVTRLPHRHSNQSVKQEPLGHRLARLRKARGLTQTDLAHHLEATQTVVSDYEIGRRRIHLQRTQQIAEILQVSVDELLGRLVPNTKETNAGVLRLKLVRRLKQIKALPHARQKAVLQTLDFLLKGTGS